MCTYYQQKKISLGPLALLLGLNLSACTFNFRQPAKSTTSASADAKSASVEMQEETPDESAYEITESFDLTQEIYSCRQIDEQAQATVCINVSAHALGNDENAIYAARQYCGANEWRVAEACPSVGIKNRCLGASLDGAFIYDKFIYMDGVSLEEECALNGGKS